jgi:hypothetical protein
LPGSGPLNTRCKIVSRKIAVSSKPRGKRRRPRRQRERALENEEFAGETVQARQPERREERDAHQAAEDRRGLAQAAEIVQPAQAAAALLDQADEIKRAEAVRPWLNICSITPLSAAAFSVGPERRSPSVSRATAKMPSRQ